MVIVGTIRPPPETRAVVDKTASFVAKNGRAFESRILNSSKGKTPKFAFLHQTSPFHAYYEERIKFYQEKEKGEGEEDEDNNEETKTADDTADNTAAKDTTREEEKNDDEEKKEEGDEPLKDKKTDKSQKASLLDPVARALLIQRAKINDAYAKLKEAAKIEEARRKKEEEKMDVDGNDQNPKSDAGTSAVVTPPPPPVTIPPKLNFVTIVPPSNLSTIQLETIKLVAQFTALDNATNHHRGATVTTAASFLHQLSMREWNNPTFSFIQPRHGHFAYFSALTDAYRLILSTWTKDDKKKADQRVDDDESFLPVEECSNNISKCLEVAAYRAEYERHLKERRREENNDDEATGANIIDWHDFVVVETIDFPIDEVVTNLPPRPPQIETKPPPSSATARKESQEAMDESDEDEEEIRVVPDYQPKVVSTENVAQDTSRTHVIDPITGKSVPISDMTEHMRIQLLDPKWAEEKKKFMDKQKDSNLVSGDAIASNISRFVSQAKGGSDLLYGKSDTDDADESKRRLEEANRIIRESQAPQPRPVTAAAVPPAPLTTTLPPPPQTTMLMPPGPPPPLPPQLAAPLHAMQLPPNQQEPPTKRPRVDHNTGDQALQPPAPPMAPEPIPQQQIPPLPAGPPPPLPEIATEGTTIAPDDTNGILSEDAFIESLSSPIVHLSIHIPNDPVNNAKWNFNGQIVALNVDVKSKVKSIKEQLRLNLGEMPLNKMQLKEAKVGFLKDALTLAGLNIGPTATLELVPKTRGGRK